MTVYMEGPLSKWTNVMKGWQYRWFVLDDNAGLLSYYTSKEKMMRGSRRGCVRLQDAIIGIDDEDDSTFTITVDLKVFHFQARDADERKQWASALEDTILRHSQRQFEVMPSPSLDEFDRRLAEADAYLKLLIENVEGVGCKINAMENGASQKQDLEGILITAQEMIEAVKKSIVLLQLAKTAVTTSVTPRPVEPVHLTKQSNYPVSHSEVVVPTHPIANSSISPESITLEEDTYSAIKSQSEPLRSRATEDKNEVIPSANGNVNGNELRSEISSLKSPELSKNQGASEMQSIGSADEDNGDASAPTAIAESNQKEFKTESLLPDAIPETSYSSSDDDGDDFFDANEEIKSDKSNRSNASGDECKQQAMEEEPVAIVEKNVDRALQEVAHETSNSDDMYMDEEAAAEREGESVEEHKSVIMHLLSQVKLGMDLTKVVLPTFILERRSLLEMYADFFSHTDYFLQISREATAEKRMMACLRFYLSTFAAGRNSSVAKKPYNPILGETFQCFWDEPSVPNINGTTELVQDGPVPWSKSHQLSFLAEQVSHHPPISAFYAEHKEHQMQFNGHIWTKSKFLGLSIGVHNIGQGCIRLLEHDEEYIVNFPNGYGRSILTIPWVELGGDCTITCEKTGYNAFVKFHTKPFYGGKVHRVTGEVFQPQTKKPFCTFEGEWNTVIYATYTSGKSECLIDTKKKKTPKTVRKIEHQLPRESRRLWEKVTYNLKMNNIDEATNAKRALEDQQRQEAKERLEKSIVYKPKHFHEDDCKNWIYNTPLTSRT